MPSTRGFRQGPECTARDLAEALSKIATSNEADTQSILGIVSIFPQFSIDSLFEIARHYYNNLLYFSLDNHVQRIWSDQTPLRSPGVPSPRPWSPENRRRLPPVMSQSKTSLAPSMGSAYSTGSSNFYQRSSAHHRRKDKDVGSILSADSGAIVDMGDGQMDGRHFPKSQSMPETRLGRPAAMSVGGSNVGVGTSKKDFGDSGLSLLSDTSNTSLMAPPPVPPKEKVLHWIMNNDKCHEGDSRDAASSKHVRSRPPSSTSPISSRRSRKQVVPPCTSSRSESAERGVPSGSGFCAQLEGSGADSCRNRPPTKPKPSMPTTSVAAAQSSTLKKPTNSSIALCSGGFNSLPISQHEGLISFPIFRLENVDQIFSQLTDVIIIIVITISSRCCWCVDIRMYRRHVYFWRRTRPLSQQNTWTHRFSETVQRHFAEKRKLQVRNVFVLTDHIHTYIF